MSIGSKLKLKCIGLVVETKLVTTADRGKLDFVLGISTGLRYLQVSFNESAEAPETKIFSPSEPIKRQISDQDLVFLGFARVFSGSLRRGQKIHVISEGHREEMEIGGLYLLMGRELEDIEDSSAGNIVGIAGLEDFVS